MRAQQRSVAWRIVAVAVVSSLIALPATAQGNSHGDPAIHGVPPSVTSFGFGGHQGFHGVPPSVTSLHFGSVQPPIHRPPVNGHRHHREFVNPFYGGVYYVPYAAYDYSDYSVMSPGVDDSMEDEYSRPGPTVFDSHGVTGREYAVPRPPEDYRPPEAENPENQKTAETAQPQEPPQDQPATVLVFKDGRQMEIENYAIVGMTLYDFSGGRSKKVALAELDLPATVKQNDDRGIEFRVPGMKSN